MAFSLQRNAKLYVSVTAGGTNTSQQVTDAMDATNTWQIPVLDGFSFSAATTTEDISVSEAGATPDRGMQKFTTAIEPVNWSFTTYIRPRYISTTHDAVERVLWEALAGPLTNAIDTTTDGSATTRGGTGVGMGVDFASSDVNELLLIQLLFDFGNTAYLIKDAVVDTAEIDFSIDAIASIAWTGFGLTVEEVTMPATWVGQAADPTSPYDQYVLAPGNPACIRNKLSSMTVGSNSMPGFSATYNNIALTGGSLTISNNITFLTPEALGVVNTPCGHFTGSRSVTGNVTAYLKDGAGTTGDLFNDLTADAFTANPQITTNFDVQLVVGGVIGDNYTKPTVVLDLEHTHFTIPEHNIEDVVAVNIEFAALPFDETSGVNDFDLTQTNELVVTYRAEE